MMRRLVCTVNKGTEIGLPSEGIAETSLVRKIKLKTRVANSVDPDKTETYDPISSGSLLFAKVRHFVYWAQRVDATSWVYKFKTPI